MHRDAHLAKSKRGQRPIVSELPERHSAKESVYDLGTSSGAVGCAYVRHPRHDHQLGMLGPVRPRAARSEGAPASRLGHTLLEF